MGAAEGPTADERREALRRAWLGQGAERVPFLVDCGEAVRATDRTLLDPAEDLRLQEELLAAQETVGDYSLPSLRPNIGIGVVAAAFGCPWQADPAADPWIRPLVTEERPEAVHDLPAPDPGTAGLNRTAWEKIEHFERHGARPLRLVNVPSPLLTASLIWEYGSFVTALLLHPREVHALLEKVTAFTLAFLRLQRQRIRRLFAFTHEPPWLPPELGIRVSDDVAALLSEDLYAEFGARYNEPLAAEFGGIVVHSCGDVGAALPAMVRTRGLAGLDIVAPQNDLSKVARVAGGRTALCLRFLDWDFPKGETPDLTAYARGLVERFGRQGLLLWTHLPTAAEARALSERLHREINGE